MVNLLTLFCSIPFLLHFVELRSFTNRRVYHGYPETNFEYPYGSIVTLRKSPDWGTFCTGILIGSRRALTAAHCFSDIQGTIYLVGYGSTKINEQNISHVADIYFCGLIDVAVVTLAITLTETAQMRFFTMERWNLDIAMERNTLKTWMCGFGVWEGSDFWYPQYTLPDVVRCHPYHFTMNHETAVLQWQRDYRWPEPATHLGSYEYNERYLHSISRDPRGFEAHYYEFSTGCIGDSGAPVFYQEGYNEFRLLGIHIAGPLTCGDAFCAFQYDTSVHMNIIKDVCFNNDPHNPNYHDELI